MAEIQHPPIHTLSPFETTLEEDFADRAYEILSLYAVAFTENMGDVEVHYPVTDRVDLISTDDSLEVAMRLVRHPSFAFNMVETPALGTGSMLQSQQPSDDYMVLGLQYGTVRDEELAENEPIVDEDFTWHPYVLAVVYPEGKDIDVLDANTGKELTKPEIMHAKILMEMMARELSGIACEGAMLGDDQIPVFHDTLHPTWEDLKRWPEFELDSSHHLN